MHKHHHELTAGGRDLHRRRLPRQSRARRLGRAAARQGAEKELWGGEAADHQQPHGAHRGDPRARGAQAAEHGARSTPIRSTCRRASRSGSTSWKRRGWRTADKKPVKNEDLWQRARRAARAARDRMALGEGPRRPPGERAGGRDSRTKGFPLAGMTGSSATDRPRYRDHRAQREARRPHHRDRLRRDPEPAHQRARTSTPTSTPSARSTRARPGCTA